MGLRGAARYVSNKFKDKPINIVEIGVRDGGNALLMLKDMNINKLYLVDHYPIYQDGPYFRNQKDQDGWYMDMFLRMEEYHSKVVLVTKSSEFASTLFKDGSLDFVYLDGDHSKEGVLNDLRVWYPKLNEDGVIGGHDFTLREYPGIKEALIEFSSNKNIKVREVEETDWIIEEVR